MKANTKKNGKPAIRMRETLVSYAFLAPALIFFILFVVYPMISGAVTSLFNYTLSKFKFVGLANYIELFQDATFLKSFRNTILLVVVAVPVIVIFSLWVSSLIYQKSAWVRSLFRGIFYLPVVTGTVAVTVVWKWMFDPLNGILNWILKSLHVIDMDIMWLGDKRFALWCIAVILFTTSIGQPIILFIAALGNVDSSLVEAAEVDGANNLQTFWKIKWPSIMPTTLYVVVITTINSFQCFALIQLLTSGGPNYNTSTIMYLVYETAFKLQRFGYANAMGMVLAAIIGLISLFQFKMFGNDVEY